MFNQQIPFEFSLLSNGDAAQAVQAGSVVSTINKCGFFLCCRGEIELSLPLKSYVIKRGDLYIYVPSTLIRILRRSADAEGFMVEVDLDYAIPVINKVTNVENILFIKENPCVSLSDEQYAHLETLLENLQNRIRLEEHSDMGIHCRRLTLELIKSMGQTVCYEVLNIYFSNRPLQPLAQNKKDVIFQNFMLSLYRFYRKERDVAFYAGLQHLSPRYFSTIIKEKSGSGASQWIIRMVVTEAKRLLETSDLSIKEIATQLNFPTQSFFGKYFKQYIGVSPKDYRKNELDRRK